jgi:hypothetical protein
MLVFLDDILIYSKNEEEYENKVHYLGHIISKEGIYVDPENIKAHSKEW